MYFIGNFVYAAHQEEGCEVDRRHGEFSLIVDAPDAREALRRYKDRIFKYRMTSDFFQGDCSVYLIQLFEFERFPVQEAMLLNYKSIAGDPLMPFIRCSLPNDQSDSCRIFDWKNGSPEIDGQEERVFVRFEAGSHEMISEPNANLRLSPEGP